jgi:hypothetical protein
VRLAALVRDARETAERRAWALQRLAQVDPASALAITEDFLAGRDETERGLGDGALRGATHASFLPPLLRRLNDREPPTEPRPYMDAVARLKDRSWSAVQATGAPDTPVDGDNPSAWASKRPEMGSVWLVLEYAEAVRPDEVRVHETYNPGAVAQIAFRTPEGSWEVVWEGTAPRGASPTWFSPSIASVRYATNAVRLVLDTDRVEGWNEIDAVELVGDRLRQWAVRATASSSYSDP